MTRLAEHSSADDLMARVASGDQLAFAALYDDLAPLVHGVVRRVLQDAAQSEEVTQEVFIEIWRDAARFDESRAPARAWASVIARRRGIDRVRSENSYRHRDERVARLAVRDATPSVADAVVERVEQRRAVAALATLSDTQREVLELAYFSGLTHTEIAARLHLPPGTVKTRVRDGLARLRRWLRTDQAIIGDADAPGG